MMPHTIEFWEPEEPHGAPPSPRVTVPRHPPANLYDDSCRRPDDYDAPHSHHPSTVSRHLPPPPPPPYPYPHGMYGGGNWKPYRGYPPVPPPHHHHGYYYPPVANAPYPPEPFHPPASTQLARPSTAAAAAAVQPPPPVVTIVNPRFETTELVYDINDHDVLCGRGAPTSWHPGNQFFRLLVDKYQGPYLAAKRMDKPEIAMRVVALVHERGGRFLKRTKVVTTTSPSRRSSPQGTHGRSLSPLDGASRGHFAWQDIGEQRAYEKACQALREGAPELRKQLAAREAMSASLHLTTTLSSDHGSTSSTAADPLSSSTSHHLHQHHDDDDDSDRLRRHTVEARNDVESPSSEEDGCRSFHA